MNSDITVIMSGYNRPQNMKRQLEAIKNQSIPPDDIMMWYNNGNTHQQSLPGVKTAHCDTNFKFHGRFAYALLAKTKYICIFDDDCIPGRRWLENCLNSYEKQEGLYGTVGVTFNGNNYWPNMKVGSSACNPCIHNNEITEVDLVGWSWFFPRTYLKYFWAYDPISWENGEDIQFSFILSQQGIKTFVPPHPISDKSLWGTIEPKLGFDKAAHSVENKINHNKDRDTLVRLCIGRGWEPLYTRLS